mgnify:CR=1 FL=1
MKRIHFVIPLALIQIEAVFGEACQIDNSKVRTLRHIGPAIAGANWSYATIQILPRLRAVMTEAGWFTVLRRRHRLTAAVFMTGKTAIATAAKETEG